MASLFSKHLAGLAALPARTAEWSGRLGPIALWGVDNRRNGSAALLRSAFQTHALRSQSDYYLDLQWHDAPDTAVDCPPIASQLLPVLDCGVLAADCDAPGAAVGGTAPKPNDYFGATMAGVHAIVEKGFVPVTFGGDVSLTLPLVEGIQQVLRTDIIVAHFGASPRLSSPASPLRVLLEKGTAKGLFHIGGRGVDGAARAVRKQHQVKYVDMNAAYSKGLFTVKDMMNNYPIYITIDLGALDPSCAPGVEDPEPGGLGVRDLLHLMHAVRGPKIVGIDILGYTPELDIALGGGPVLREPGSRVGLTALSASKIAKEAIVKAYSIATVTQAEAMARVAELKKQGQLPEQYPD